MERILTKELKHGQVVIADNASFHKSPKARKLIESVPGCRFIFLPPYLPDFNPIEKTWANMKRYIKNVATKTEEVYKALEQFFREIPIAG